MPLILQNIILFQLGWFACVLTGAGMLPPFTGIAAVTLIVVIHLLRADDSTSELFLVILALLIGTLWESVLLLTGVFNYSTGQPIDSLAPVWLIALWPLFATLLNVSMKWLKGKYWLAAICGFTGGPLAFYSGHKIGAVEFSNTTIALLVIAAGWALLMPLLIALASRFNGYFGPRAGLQEAGIL